MASEVVGDVMRASVLLSAAMMMGAAMASPITTPPPVITGLGGDVTAVFVYASANDASFLALAPSTTPIFCNNPTAGCPTASTAGQTSDLGILSGLLTFTLDNTTTGYIYDSTNSDSDGNYHTIITTNYADFNVGALPSAAGAVLGSLPNVTFVGFEDRQLINNSDWDYNDLIFAFSNTTPAHHPPVPEPLTLSLLGAGLAAAFGLRRARKS